MLGRCTSLVALTATCHIAINMEYLHLARKKNIKSILKYGIVPSHIDLDHHWDTFNRAGLDNRLCVYTWQGETYENSKFIRDMIYTKFFIHPRNHQYAIQDDEIDWTKLGGKIFGSDETFLLLKIPDMDMEFGDWVHVQEPHDDRYGTTVQMDDKYAHDDKIITISDSVIKPSQFQICEEIRVRTYKNNQIGFSHSKYKG